MTVWICDWQLFFLQISFVKWLLFPAKDSSDLKDYRREQSWWLYVIPSLIFCCCCMFCLSGGCEQLSLYRVCSPCASAQSQHTEHQRWCQNHQPALPVNRGLNICMRLLPGEKIFVTKLNCPLWEQNGGNLFGEGQVTSVSPEHPRPRNLKKFFFYHFGVSTCSEDPIE